MEVWLIYFKQYKLDLVLIVVEFLYGNDIF